MTGATGFLGAAVVQALAARGWEGLGLARKPLAKGGPGNFLTLDLTEALAIQRLPASVRAVIHLAALSRPESCEIDPESSFRNNVTATEAVVNFCEQRSIPLLFTSTDLVFDGQGAPYSESAATRPINVYGRHKVLAENTVTQSRQRQNAMLVCRLPLMFGPAASNFFATMVPALRSGRPIQLFVDEFRTQLSSAAAARGLLLFLEHLLNGTVLPPLVHLAGLERISRYDMGVRVANLLHLPTHGIVPCLAQSVVVSAARPQDTSLESEHALTLGWWPPAFDDDLQQALISLGS